MEFGLRRAATVVSSTAFSHILSNIPAYWRLEYQLDAGMWRYHTNRMDARRSQFDLGWVDAYI